MASSHTLIMGRHEPAVRAALERLRTLQALSRLWDRDASLWSAEASVQASIRQRLGWLTITSAMRLRLTTLRQTARACAQAGFTRAVLLGMGGSGLFAEVCRGVFGVERGALELTLLDTTDPSAIRACIQRGPLRQLLVLVLSKSGTTIEVTSLARFFEHALAAEGVTPGEHLVVITDAGTPLAAQAASWKARATFALEKGLGQDVGGRFSAMTPFGLMPAALLGVEIDRLLEQAEAMGRACGPAVAIEQNPAAQLGAVLGAFAQAGCNKCTLLCEPQLSAIGVWVEQMIAESTGKDGQGIVPVIGEPLPLGALTPDRFVVALQWRDARRSAIEESVSALIAAGVPVVQIRLEDPYDLGGEVMRWSIATSLAGVLLGVNPFDEPNVQESKDRTLQLLTEWSKAKQFPQVPPLPSLAGWMRQARAGDYIAMLSYLPRTDAIDRLVQTMRQQVARLGYPTLLGMGPRYLHSTGQLFKGGPDQGVFLLLTADEPHDLPIPGQPYTFGVLKQAQALGDVQAMRQRGRRLLHVHLHGDPERSAQQLVQSIEEVIGRLS